MAPRIVFNTGCFRALVCMSYALALGACSEPSDQNDDDPSSDPGSGGSPGAASGGQPAAGSGGAADTPNMAGMGSTAGMGAGGSVSGGTGGLATDAGVGPGDAEVAPGDAGMMPSDAGGEPRADLGKGDGKDVIAIGDSWMSLGTRGIQQSLVAVSMQPYRTYGRGGTRLLNDQIPNQYAMAKMVGSDIKTVVMTGGGNDIIQVPGLRMDCTMMGMMCKQVVGMILDKLTMLWTQMSKDGVQDIVYVLYSNPEGNNVDFAQTDGDSARKRCAEVPAPTRCHVLETLDIVMGDIPDGIHPSAAGYDRVGKAVHELMIAKGMRR